MVNHDILLQKLDKYGVRGTAHQWFVSYLKNRKHLVETDCMDVKTDEIEEKRSAEAIIRCWVLQGSILGPPLSLIYIYNMDTNIGIKLTLFADDNSISIIGKDTQDLIFNLGRINGSILPWFHKNR